MTAPTWDPALYLDFDDHRSRPFHDLLARVSDGVAVSDQFVGAFSPVMILHTGPGIVGLAWWWEAGDGSPAAS
jgi:hypothetical protein